VIFPVHRDGIRWIVTIPYPQRNIAKDAGFRWCPQNRHWYTTREDVAKLLMDPAAAEAKRDEFARIGAERKALIEESRAASVDIELPAPHGLEYLPFQRAGIATALKRGNVLFGDDMGLGKTIQVIGMINAREDVRRVLIVCPATLKQNWQRELNKWLVRKFRIGIAEGQKWPGGYADITIINFDILEKHAYHVQGEVWDLVAIDEAHYLKNRDAKRTRAVFGVDSYTAKRKDIPESPGVRGRLQIGMTGTPIPNRPSEGFGLFHWLAPNHECFKSFYVYAKKFTGSFAYPGAGYDQNGATNLDELQAALRGSIMIRRTKEQVLKELPAKRRVVIELEAESASDAVEDEREAAESHEEELDRLRAAVELAKASSESAYNDAVAALKKGASVAFTEMSRLRHETAMATLPHAVEHVLTALRADDSHKVVVFCHHGDVAVGMLSALAEAGIGTASITQKTPIMDRQAESDRFQTDPDCRVFVGGIQSAGVGITLTAAWHVVFVELDWVPGNMSQAEDRCNRIGQRNSVLCEHLVIQGSIAATMAKRLVAKQNVIDSALDCEHPERLTVEQREMMDAPIVPGRSEAATQDTPRTKYAKIAETLTPAQIAAVHQALRMLADFDCDHAKVLNGIGFSRIDGMIGHSLADCGRLTPKQAALGQTLVRKYRKQVPESLLTQCGI
jgi:SWI/SNF-related matrix-associated actin-dependent regulator 1 of chromatin subfamily A